MPTFGAWTSNGALPAHLTSIPGSTSGSPPSTTAWAFHRRIKPGFSSRFSPPRRKGKGRGWAWPQYTTPSSTTMAPLSWKAFPARARPFTSVFPWRMDWSKRKDPGRPPGAHARNRAGHRGRAAAANVHRHRKRFGWMNRVFSANRPRGGGYVPFGSWSPGGDGGASCRASRTARASPSTVKGFRKSRVSASSTPWRPMISPSYPEM